ncbi:MAG TPA: SOS response-associated peptidase [Fimbriimonadaceae bacterium]|nr:SOS response-associated peptidase [Fimbriimonadaceae bacterium]
MCARFAFFKRERFQLVFGLDPDGIEPQYNIAPTDVVAAVTDRGQGRQLEFFQWGLVPSWAKDPSIGQKLINARAETLAEKPSFKAAFKRRRCLLPADGFYEWKGEKGHKQPYFIHLRSKQTFALAGLWEEWETIDGALATCTIVTTDANEMVSDLHTRMPVLIPPDDFDAWLDPKADGPVALLAPYPSDEMEMHPVAKAVSNPRFKSPEAVEPVGPDALF